MNMTDHIKHITELKTYGDALEMHELLPKNEAGKQLVHCWSSPEALGTFVRSLDGGRNNWYNDCWDNDRNRGFATMDLALAAAVDGWHEGADRARGLIEKIDVSHPMRHEPPKWSFSGSTPNVPMYLAGAPAHMKHTDMRRTRRKPVITLVSNMSVHWGIGPDVIERRAVVTAAVVDRIEDAGFACEVIGYAASGGQSVAWTVATRLKESSQPLDLARMVFGLGHPSMFRRLGFACATCHQITRPLGGGLGTPHRPSTEERLSSRGVYLLMHLNEREFASDDVAADVGLKNMISALQKQGCPAFKEEN